MNLPNKLTLFRIILTPFFCVFMLIPQIPLHYLWALLIFTLASLTDMADGKIARKYNLITSLGKFLDPLADKILTLSALICMIPLGWCPAWVVVVIMAREFAVSGIRLAAAGSKEKIVIAADFLGKVKTAVTMGSVVLVLLLGALEELQLLPYFAPSGDAPPVIAFDITLLGYLLFSLCAVLTIISGVQYIWKFRSVFKDENQ